MARGADRPERLLAIGLTCYRRSLRLYPASFYRQYADELEADFQDASDEAADGGIAVLAGAWLRAWGDLPLSLAREWLRTPWPPVHLVAIAVACLVLFSSIVRAYGPLQRYRLRVAANVPPPADSPQLLMLMLLMVLIPIAGIVIVSGVITLTNWRTRDCGRRV